MSDDYRYMSAALVLHEALRGPDVGEVVATRSCMLRISSQLVWWLLDLSESSTSPWRNWEFPLFHRGGLLRAFHVLSIPWSDVSTEGLLDVWQIQARWIGWFFLHSGQYCQHRWTVLVAGPSDLYHQLQVVEFRLETKVLGRGSLFVKFLTNRKTMAVTRSIFV